MQLHVLTYNFYNNYFKHALPCIISLDGP